MLVMKSDEVKTNFKAVCDSVWNGETVVVSRPKSRNIVVLSEPKYRQIVSEHNNAELGRRLADAKAGKVITFTLEELEAFETMDSKDARAFANKRRAECGLA